MSEPDELAALLRERSQEVRGAGPVRRASVVTRGGAMIVDLLLFPILYLMTIGLYELMGMRFPFGLRAVAELMLLYGSFALYTSIELAFGASLGKLLLELRVALPNGGTASRGRLLRRWLIKYSFLHLLACWQILFVFVRELVMRGKIASLSSFSLFRGVLDVLQIASLCAAVSILLGMIGAFLPARRALHDWLSGTAVYQVADLVRDPPPVGRGFEVQRRNDDASEQQI